MDGESRDRVCLGIITGAHGIRGEVRIQVFAADPAGLGAYGPLEDDAGQRYRVERLRPAGNAAVAKLAGVDDRNRAEALKGTKLYVARAALPEADEEEWYHADLIGLGAVTEAGERLGTVIAIHDFGAGTLIEVDPGDGATQLVPFTRQHVPEVDVAGGRLVVVPLEAAEDEDGPEGTDDR